MKKFDVASISSRQKESLSKSEQWQNVLQEGSVESLIDSDAEARAELARYFEHIMRETKWDTCRNLSSVLSQTPYLGYKPRRRTSSIGYIMMSHDPALANAGIGPTSFDAIVASLSPYTEATPYTILKGTQFKAGNSLCVSTEEVTYTIGDKYLMIPVVEGELITTEPIEVFSNPFEAVVVPDPSIEANATQASGKFFSITSSGLDEPLIEVDSIFLATRNEYAYDVTSNSILTETRVRFGNGIAGKKIPAGTIQVRYLSSKGGLPEGNLGRFLTWANETPPSGITFYYKNIDPITGGRAVDTIDTIKANAPKQYLLDGSIVTSDNYKTVIESIPNVLRARVYSGEYYDETTLSRKDAIIYTAIDSTGKAFIPANIQASVENEISGRNNPLDFYTYEAPKFLHMRLNVSGKNTTTEVEILKEQVYNLLYDKYKTVNQPFKGSYDQSVLIQEIKDLTGKGLENINIKIEAVKELTGSMFTQYPAETNYYVASFNIDPSFLRLEKNRNHCLRIDVYMPCEGCEPKRRTLMLIANPDNSFEIKQYKYIDENYDTTDDDWTEALLANQQPLFPELTDATAEIAERKIPFQVDLNMDTFVSVDKTVMAVGSIYIPESIGLTDPYFDFSQILLDSIGADRELKVRVIARPTDSSKVLPVFDSNIIRIDGGGEEIFKDILVGGIRA